MIAGYRDNILLVHRRTTRNNAHSKPRGFARLGSEQMDLSSSFRSTLFIRNQQRGDKSRDICQRNVALLAQFILGRCSERPVGRCHGTLSTRRPNFSLVYNYIFIFSPTFHVFPPDALFFSF